MQLKSEVLPAPLGPTRQKIAFGSTPSVTFSSTVIPPKLRFTSRRLRRAAIRVLSRVAALLRGVRSKIRPLLDDARDRKRDCQRFWTEFRHRCLFVMRNKGLSRDQTTRPPSTGQRFCSMEERGNVGADSRAAWATTEGSRWHGDPMANRC